MITKKSAVKRKRKQYYKVLCADLDKMLAEIQRNSDEIHEIFADFYNHHKKTLTLASRQQQN